MSFHARYEGGVLTEAVFEDEAFADKATMAVEKQIHEGGDGPAENTEEVGTEKGQFLRGEGGEKSVV